jgi:2-polyprenyl-3-methyl-5-hydroxy-6-metoxy-1,4-benzoquinol methylase
MQEAPVKVRIKKFALAVTVEDFLHRDRSRSGHVSRHGQRSANLPERRKGLAMQQSESRPVESLNQKVRDIWDHNAQFWDARMGEGNSFHKTLIEPTQERLLNVCPRQRILDLACGNGQFARRLCRLGASVLGVDFSERMIDRARTRTTDPGDRIEFRVLDCTRAEALLSLGEKQFDAAVCTMALMDMAAIDPLFTALAKLLKAGGCFVFSVLHPCFNSGRVMQVREREDVAGQVTDRYFVRVADYIQPLTHQGVAMIGQPVPQYYFHRPLSLLLKPAFAAGFVLDDLAEPVYEAAPEGESRLFEHVYSAIPPALVARLRLP